MKTLQSQGQSVSTSRLRASLGDKRSKHFASYLRFRGTLPGECIALEAIDPTSKSTRFYATMLGVTMLTNGAEQLLRQSDEDIEPKGCFVHQNLLLPHVMARYTADTWSGLRSGEGIKDTDIAARRGLYIDLDPQRPRDTSSTEAELESAFEVAKHLLDSLVEVLGDDSPLGLGMSGNGIHVHVALADLPNTVETTTLVRETLEAAAAIFGTPQVKVDASVSDARRVCPAYGTTKRKGGNYQEQSVPVEQHRPHRQTAFICGDHVRRLSLDELVALRDALRERAPKSAAVEPDGEDDTAAVPSSPVAASGKSDTSGDSPWTMAKSIPIETVSEWLGLGSGSSMVCPGCGSTAGYGVIPGANLVKCHHDRCGDKGMLKHPGVRSVIDLTMEVKGVDARTALGHVASQFGIALPLAPSSSPAKASAPPSPPPGITGAPWEAALLRDRRGKIHPWTKNVTTILQHDPDWSGVLAFDELQHAIVFQASAPAGFLQRAPGEQWMDEDDVACANWLQTKWQLPIAPLSIRGVVALAAKFRTFHPIRDFLSELKWDGLPRVDTWLSHYLGVQASPYVQRVGRWWLISAVARIYKPGCKADCMLVLEGKQGIRKSSALRELAGDEFFLEDMREIGGVESLKQLAGKWIAELAELDAFRKAENSTVKKFLSTRVDNYRPSYGRSTIDFPRQCVFAGTTNHEAYLSDETGARRIWPVRCGKIDLKAITRDRAQLWAEAVTLYKAGDKWWPDTDEDDALCAAEQEERSDEDAWMRLIREYVADKDVVTTQDILTTCIGIEHARMGDRELKRVASVLRRLAWERCRNRDKQGRQIYVFKRTNKADPRLPNAAEAYDQSMRRAADAHDRVHPFSVGSPGVAKAGSETPAEAKMLKASDLIS